MKLRPLWLALPACAVMTASCKKEEPAAAKEQPAAEKPATPAKAGETTPAPKPSTPALSADERAAKFGIVKHLPKDSDSFLTIYNGSKIAERAKKTKLWSVIKEEAGDALPEEADAAGDKKDGPSGPGALLGHEVFLATGKGMSDQFGHLITVNRRMSYFQGKLFAKLLVAASKGGSEEGMKEESANISQQSMLEILKDPQSGVGLLEKMQVPPVYIGFKTSAADREQVAQQVASIVEYMGMAEDMVEPVEFDSAGVKFKGYRLVGEKVSKEMAKNRADMEKDIDPETAGRLIAAVAKKNIIAASAVLGDYVVVFMGSAPEDCKLVAEAKDGIAASDDVAFADGYAGKELAGLAYTSKAFSTTAGLAGSGLAEMTNGLRDGLAGAEGLGDTRDIEAMLQIIGEREQALQKLTTADTLGLVSFFEEGLKIETFGGTDKGAVDWKTPNRLGGLGNSKDVIFFANFTTDAVYDEKARAYVESLVETGYAVAKKFSDAPIKTENEDFKKFQEGMKMFDTKFRTDVVSLVDALRGDLHAGLGKESAIVVDLKGGVPTIPGLPQEVVDKGKFVRASWISPVTDRTKIQSSWSKINTSTTSILKKVSEIAGDEIPMQKPTSSEKNGFTTWFFQAPFFNEDFMPSVTVSDKWFVVSTSKSQAVELGTAADKENTPGSGFTMSVKIDPMRQFGLDWVKLVDENSAKLFDTEDKLNEFKENKPKIEKSLKALEDFEAINVAVRRENGRLRGSIHFKTH
ncbi:hypothetical protein KBB96_02085 [Luteolibacter ambystomatis]|uniref:Uncharacterized protein n=1 Tax=Luteolibacter ambystomatis TaxID=2824561 RepID=A0A975J0D1_9BACT|nr:hypothetical protein [Luteolibacter ambystomatis]QUE51690.1 hypothetical protein KBB96_02085 [Luteolibacter ambystomatis]